MVADVGHHDSYSIPRRILYGCAKRLEGLPALFVGVRCPVEVILERRCAAPEGYLSGDPDEPIPEPVLRWQREVHVPGIYDLEVDTSLLSPRECAEAIRRRLQDAAHPTALQKLIELGDGKR